MYQARGRCGFLDSHTGEAETELCTTFGKGRTMPRLLTCCLLTASILQSAPLNADDNESEMQHFLGQEWGFECQRLDGSQVVRGVRARQIEEERAKRFLGSLSGLKQLDIWFSPLETGDIRSLAQRCPQLDAIAVTGPTLPIAGLTGSGAPFEASCWPEFFEFRRLKHLRVKNLHCSGDEAWSPSHVTELDTLDVSGNLSGMLPFLLAPCNTRSLRVEFFGGRQQLTAADHAAINRHPEIESLAIDGSPLGSDIFVDLTALSGLAGLRCLSLEQCCIDPLDLIQFRGLEELTLQRCRFIKHDFAALLEHPGLEDLTLDDCSNEGLRIAGPFAAPSRRLRSLTLRSPVLEEIGTFAGISRSCHVEFRPGCCYASDKTAHILRRFGEDEVELLERLDGLHSVSVSGWGLTEVSTSALFRLMRSDTLRTIDIRDADLVEDTPPGSRERPSHLEEVRIEADTLRSQDLVARFVGGNTHRVFLGDYSGALRAPGHWNGTVDADIRTLGLLETALPITTSCLYGQLFSPSVQDLTLGLCKVNRGAIEQLVHRTPSLRRLTLDICSVEDEEELLHLNEFKDLERIDFTDTRVSAEIALAMKAEHVRFGSR